jgi:uncharacterized protein
VKLSNSFEVPLSVEEAWPTLLDVERAAQCVPGAEVLEIVDDKTYKGKVSVKLGPVTLAFTGKAWFTEIDEARHRASLHATGTDLSGRGGAQAKTLFQLRPTGSQNDKTKVLVETDLQLSGAVAQYGRASGVIADVAAQLVDEFAECLRQRLAAGTLAAQVEAQPGDLANRPSQAEPPSRPLGGLAFIWRVLMRRIRSLLARLRGNA